MSGVGVAGLPARTLTYPVPNVQPFGIYRRAIPEWQEYAYESLIDVQQPVRTLIDSLPVPPGSGERFEINDAFALTYVERRDVKLCSELGDIDLDQVIERVGNLTASNEVVSVPILDLEWRASHIVAPFDQDTYEYQRLLDQQWQIERILSEAGMEEPPVNRPHHTSLSSIRFEPMPLHTRLMPAQRRQIIAMMSERLTNAGIDSAELGNVIVGQDYTTPFTPGNLLTNACVEIVSYGGLDGGG